MSTRSSLSVRGFLRRIHRWIGVGLLVLLIPIGLSGSLLVWHDDLELMLHPGRQASSGPLLPAERYVAAAAAAVGDGSRLAMLRYPGQAGAPVTVMARGSSPGGGPNFMTVYLDPPTARVLDVVNARATLFGFLHRFHENLTIPDFSGRQIVGWAGTGMLILSLSGLWIWWPRNGAFRAGLRWRRGPATTSNLHHLVGFWISLPLALLSLTGIYLAFPQTARTTMAALAPMSPQGQRPGMPIRDAALTPDKALELALAVEPGAAAAAIFLPAVAPDRGQAGRSAPPPAWRVQLRKADGDTVSVLVDDRRGEAKRMPDPLAGDRAAQWIRWIHDGGRGGPVWQIVVVLTGLCPAILGFTGVIVWLRGRRVRAAVAAGPVRDTTGLSPAE